MVTDRSGEAFVRGGRLSCLAGKRPRAAVSTAFSPEEESNCMCDFLDEEDDIRPSSTKIILVADASRWAAATESCNGGLPIVWAGVCAVSMRVGNHLLQSRLGMSPSSMRMCRTNGS